MGSTRLALLAIMLTSAMLVLESSLWLSVDASPNVARLAFFNFPWYEDGILFDDGGYTQALDAIAPLAVAMFNERRDDILPILGTLGSCNKNLSIPYSCATGGNARLAFSQALEVASIVNYPHIFIGPETSAEAQSVSLVASTWNIPVISYWATSPRLADKGLFPTFMRTIFNDAAGAYYGAQLVNKLGYTRCGLLYGNNDFFTAYKDGLFTETSQVGVTLRFQAFDSENLPTISKAMRVMKQSKLNIIFVMCYIPDLPYLAQAFEEEEMADQDILFIFLTLDSTDAAIGQVDGAASPEVALRLSNLLHGSLFFAPSAIPNIHFTEFKQKLRDNEFLPYTDDVNAMLQPNGYANRLWLESCVNASISNSIPNGFLGGNIADFAFDVWAYVFDMVITSGLALCQVEPVDPLPSTLDPDFELELLRKMNNIKFEGFSGPVSFDNSTGDRIKDTFRYDLYNFHLQAGETAKIEAAKVGEFNHGTNVWDIVMENVNWRSGLGSANIPTETVRPVENTNYLPVGLKVLGYVEVAFLNVLCIGSAVWLLKNAKDRVVINAQGSLLVVMCVGCLIASWSILALTADDQIHDMLNENVSCMVAPILFSIGFQLALLALLGKIYRIFVLFKSSKKLRRQKINTSHVLFTVALVMAVEIIIMISWIVIAPLRFERIVATTDEYGLAVASFGQCSGGPTCVAFVAVLFGLHAFAMVATGYASSKVRDLPVEFQESRYLNLAILSMSQIYLIAIPTVVATYSNVVGRFVIMSTVVLVTVGALVLFMVVPKMFRETFGMHSKDHSSEENPASPNAIRISKSGAPHFQDNANYTSNNDTVMSVRSNMEKISSVKIAASVPVGED